MVTSQVTEAERGSAECLIVVRNSETDLDTSIKCVMTSPVKVVNGEMLLAIILFCVWSIETLFRACLRAGVSYLHRAQCWSVYRDSCVSRHSQELSWIP